MKKLFVLLCIICLFSCEKDNTQCWVCKVDSITMIKGSIVGTSTTLINRCGMTTEEIFSYEETGTQTTIIDRVQNGLYSFDNVVVTTSTNCKPQ